MNFTSSSVDMTPEILKRKLGEMMGRESREFCALNDAEFEEALSRILKP